MILLTQFEKAYIALYNDRITEPEFAEAAGIPDKEEAPGTAVCLPEESTGRGNPGPERQV